MCTENQLQQITDAVAKEAKKMFAERLDRVILFGSYARGDFDRESDIDIMVCVNCSAEELHGFLTAFVSLSGKLSIEHGVTVSVIVSDTEGYRKYKDVLPFYKNVEREGIEVA